MPLLVDVVSVFPTVLGTRSIIIAVGVERVPWVVLGGTSVVTDSVTEF